MAKTRVSNFTGAPVTLPAYGIFLEPGKQCILDGTPAQVRANMSPSLSRLVADDIRFEVALDSDTTTPSVPPIALPPLVLPITNPSPPVDGQIWFDGTNLNFQIGGVIRTIQLV